MKLSNILAVVCTAALLACSHVNAQTTVGVFSGGNSIGTTVASAIVSAKGAGAARVQYINATADNATNKLIFYTSGTSVEVTNAAAASQAVIGLSGSANFTANDVIVTRSLANDTYQRLVVSATTTTNITATANLSFALAVGDLVYKQTVAGLVPVGSATKELIGSAWNGQYGLPLLVDVTGAAACSLNTISGIFQRSP